MSAKEKEPKPLRQSSGRPSASPADAAAAAETEAKVRYREAWRDGIMRSGAQLLAGLLPVPHWKKRLDLAELAVKIAQTRNVSKPHDCLREASELMLAAASEIEWMENGRFEEARQWAQEEAEQEIHKMATEGYSPEQWAEWEELVPWERLCYQDQNEKPDPVLFLCGLTFEPYSRSNKFRELLKACCDAEGCEPDVVERLMEQAQAGKMKKLYVQRLALFRSKKNRVKSEGGKVSAGES